MKVIIDNITAKIEFGYFGTFSERILINFESPHPEYGNSFTTKYYTIQSDKSTITWGHDNKVIKWTSV